MGGETAGHTSSGQSAPVPRRRRAGHKRRPWPAGVRLALVGGALLAAGLFVRARMRSDLLDRDLLEAIQNGQRAQVRALLDQGADPNARDEPVDPHAGPQDTAALIRHLWRLLRGERRSKLLHSLPTPTALMYAARQGDAASVDLLLARGASVNERGGFGDTALILACTGTSAGPDNNGVRPRMVRALIDRGADVHAVNRHGDTALLLAVSAGDAATARLLLEQGADPNVRDRAGRSAPKVARALRRPDLVTLLAAGSQKPDFSLAQP